MKRRRRLRNLGLAVVVVAVLAAAISSLGPSDDTVPEPPTTPVVTGSVLATVGATGNVVADTELGLDFTTGGRVVEVAVAEGQRVEAGAVLVRLDPGNGRDSRARARADLAGAQAELARVRQGLSPAARAANGARVAQAQSALAAAETARTGAERAAKENESGYKDSEDQARRAVDAARDRAEVNRRSYDDAIKSAEQEEDVARRALDDARRRPTSGDSFTGAITGALTGGTASAAANLRSARAAVAEARNAERTGRLNDAQAVETARDEVVNAQNQAATGRVADRRAVDDATARINQAKADVAAAQADARVQEAPPTAAEVAAARAGVDAAAAGVRGAERDLAEVTLTAPVASTVARLEAEVGELVTGGTSGLGDSGRGVGDAASATVENTDGLVVLTDLGSLLVKAGFSEVDAARLAPGQPATVTFEALPGQAPRARVASVDTAPSVVRNVVTYVATLVVTQDVTGVRPGMTASVDVVTEERSGVLVVPNTAISGPSGRPVVAVFRDGAEVTRPVTLGLRGDSASEIVSGLAAGDRVLTRGPTVTTTTVGRPGQ
ncbi:MAG: hypothetical protein ACT4OS_00195 [Acidimicrobiales bacterium]